MEHHDPAIEDAGHDRAAAGSHRDAPFGAAGCAGPPASSRRSLLEWLGAAAVVSLASPLLQACSPAAEVAAEGFQFRPGKGRHPVFRAWDERTVDDQEPREILARWRLGVYGMAAREVQLTFAEVLALPRRDQVRDFHCVEGWSVRDVPWNGVPLAALLDLVQPTARATHVAIHTFHGVYNGSLPLSVAREPDTLLAYGVGGSTLPLAHGFPLRLVVPRMLGYVSAKYVYQLELTDRAVTNYWEMKGYDYGGEVPRARLRPGR